MRVMYVSRKKAIEVIENSKGKFVTVCFIKRSNGEKRILNGRLSVSKGVKGVGFSFDPEEKGLIPIWDAQIREHRFVSKEAVLWVNFQQTHYIVKENV